MLDAKHPQHSRMSPLPGHDLLGDGRAKRRFRALRVSNHEASQRPALQGFGAFQPNSYRQRTGQGFAVARSRLSWLRFPAAGNLSSHPLSSVPFRPFSITARPAPSGGAGSCPVCGFPAGVGPRPEFGQKCFTGEAPQGVTRGARSGRSNAFPFSKTYPVWELVCRYGPRLYEYPSAEQNPFAYPFPLQNRTLPPFEIPIAHRSEWLVRYCSIP